MTFRCLLIVMLFVISASAVYVGGQSTPPPAQKAPSTVAHLKDFPVVEFRRYTVRPGEAATFAKYFEALFPESFEQLGALALGDFLEPQNPQHFTWIRGFHEMDDRAKINSAFYYGPLWKEHKVLMNALMTDSDNVLLLRPLRPDTSIPVLPAVDVVAESSGAQGVVVAEIFQVKPGKVDDFANAAANQFSGYATGGIRNAGILVTLEVNNNFPQLPVRTDGPFLVWLGIAHDDAAARDLIAKTKNAEEEFNRTGFLQKAPEVVLLKPNPRSRLRWIDSH